MLLLTGIIIILMTIGVFYGHDRITILGDIDVDYFSAFGEFIGGVVGTIFTAIATMLIYLTFIFQRRELRETKKLIELQSEQNFSPEIYIKGITLDVIAELINGKYYPAYFLSDEGRGKIYDFFEVELINIGVHAAKDIKLNWVYDIKKAIEFISDKVSPDILKLDDLGDELAVHKGQDDSVWYPYTNFDHEVSFGFLLPHTQSGESRMVGNNANYLEWLMTYAYYNTHDLGRDVFYGGQRRHPSQFPKFRLSIEYQDIHSRHKFKYFESKFDIDVDTIEGRIPKEENPSMGRLHIDFVEIQPFSVRKQDKLKG